jgi:hypothetical protein
VHLIERYAVRRVILAHGRMVDAPDGSPLLSDADAPEAAVRPLAAGTTGAPLVLPDIRPD